MLLKILKARVYKSLELLHHRWVWLSLCLQMPLRKGNQGIHSCDRNDQRDRLFILAIISCQNHLVDYVLFMRANPFCIVLELINVPSNVALLCLSAHQVLIIIVKSQV